MDDAFVEAVGFFFPELDRGRGEAKATPVRGTRDRVGEAEGELGDAGGESEGGGLGAGLRGGPGADGA